MAGLLIILVAPLSLGREGDPPKQPPVWRHNHSELEFPNQERCWGKSSPSNVDDYWQCNYDHVERHIGKFIEYCTHAPYHKLLTNLAPVDVFIWPLPIDAQHKRKERTTDLSFTDVNALP